MTEPSSANLAEGALVADKLRVVRALGEGGMGAVYEVEHVFTKHRRALKLLHAQFAASPAVVARFLREASAAGRIGNPHIVETFDAGQLPSGEPFLVMELLSGTPLDRHLARRGRLPPAEAIAILRQACDGVQAAHQAGIVHRDLKPENLFLQLGDEPFVKILDFGISKFDDSLVDAPALTTEGSILGTPFYMSPEQVRGESLDVRADIYALGVVLYECLSGRRPFHADNLAELGVKIHEGKHTPLRELHADIPEDLARVVATAMAVDKNRRYETASELERALAAIEPNITLASSATVALAPSEPPPAASHALSGAPARTDATHEPGPSRGSSRKSLWPLWAVLAVVAIGAGLLMTRAPGAIDEEPSRAPATQSDSATPPTAQPLVSPSLAAESAAPARVTPPPPEPSAGATRSVRRSSAPPPAASKKPPSDRGSQHQIAEENPF